MNAEQILRAAAERLRKKGWCQGEPVDYLGRACMLGAVNRVPINVVNGWSIALITLERVCGGSVVDFNDAYDMTKRDAIAALEIAADLAAP